jgi:flagellar L-ring protein FlgH
MRITKNWELRSKELELGTENWEPGSKKLELRTENLRPGTKLFKIFLVLTSYFSVLGFFFGCASAPPLPPHPPKYVYKDDKPALQTSNSLWRDNTPSLFEDRKARRLNDLVTIKVVENITGSGTADTNTKRGSSSDYGITDLFGMNTDFGLQKWPLLKELYKGGKLFTPSLEGSSKSDFAGQGDTSREGKLVGTITAKVVEVMPNGNLALEARKDLTINNEKQILVLRGMIRPDDVAADNTVLSSSVADAEIFFVGDGVIQEKQRPGWLSRTMDTVWPF